MIIVLVALVALIAMSSLAIDVGMLWAARTQLQNAADAAALAGAMNLIDPAGPSVTARAATNAAVEVCGRNGAICSLGCASNTERHWGEAYAENNASMIADHEAGQAAEAFFSKILGRQGFHVGASATAYLGFAGNAGSGKVNLPIAIDCCKLRGSNCSQDYCETIETNPPKACDLVRPQDDGVKTVSCLVFSPTDDQNACWTQFNESDASVNANDLRDIIEDGNPTELTTEDSIFVDNGDKASVIHELANAFYGAGAYTNDKRGEDLYFPKDGISDSWVQGLPVVECQEEGHCAQGDPDRVVGFVCLEIREIERSPLNLIRGRFLCAGDPLLPKCDFGRTTTGGLDFDVRADIPVLVR
jgi:hypothetical protein